MIYTEIGVVKIEAYRSAYASNNLYAIGSWAHIALGLGSNS